jgi:hypothetical protein
VLALDGGVGERGQKVPLWSEGGCLPDGHGRRQARGRLAARLAGSPTVRGGYSAVVEMNTHGARLAPSLKRQSKLIRRKGTLLGARAAHTPLVALRRRGQRRRRWRRRWRRMALGAP